MVRRFSFGKPAALLDDHPRQLDKCHNCLTLFPARQCSYFMKIRSGRAGYLYFLVASWFVFATWQSLANNVEVDWSSGVFSSTHITINAGDEVDIVNFDDTFDLQLTGAPPE